MNPNSHIFTSTYCVKLLKSKLTQKVKINIDENNLNFPTKIVIGRLAVYFYFRNLDAFSRHFALLRSPKTSYKRNKKNAKLLFTKYSQGVKKLELVKLKNNLE